MIDIHCHILPGVDDGPQTLEDSFKLARFCVDDGITHIVATPHCHRYVHLLRHDILPRVIQLNKDLNAAGVPLTILPGSEIQVTDSTEYRREFEAGVYCHLGDKHDFTLLEFNWAREQFPVDAVKLVEWIRARGTTPILAHPERHAFFAADDSLLPALVEAGAWIQVTVDSLLGNHGPTPKVLGEVFLRTYPKAVLATDAHNMQRCSGMAAGYEWVRKNFSEDRALDLQERSEIILRAILAGEKVPQPVH